MRRLRQAVLLLIVGCLAELPAPLMAQGIRVEPLKTKPVDELMLMSHRELIDEAINACIYSTTWRSLAPMQSLAATQYTETLSRVERKQFGTIAGVDRVQTALGGDADGCVAVRAKAIADIAPQPKKNAK